MQMHVDSVKLLNFLFLASANTEFVRYVPDERYRLSAKGLPALLRLRVREPLMHSEKAGLSLLGFEPGTPMLGDCLIS